MQSKLSNSRLSLPLISVVTGCLLVTVAAVAMHLRPSSRLSYSQPSTSQSATQLSGTRTASSTSDHRLVASYDRLPLAFEANLGQTDPQVKYVARGRGYTLFLTADEAVLSLQAAAPKPVKSRLMGPTKTAVVHMQMVGANPHSTVAGSDLQTAVSNYYIGNDPRKWRTGVPNYSRVAYLDVYPGINLAFYGAQRQLEFDFIVGAGADSKAIGLHFSGAKHIATDNNGDLLLSSAAGDMQFHKPVAYQEQNGTRQPVSASFVVKNDEVRFALGNYDRSRELVIDPSLSYSTYLGGTGDDHGTGIAVDSSGNAYVSGQAATGFPTTIGPSFAGAAHDASLTKFSSTGTLTWSTFIGSTGDDAGLAVAVDSSGNAYLAGNTQAGLSFPSTTNLGAGGQEAFVAKFNSNGVVQYATLIGGSSKESANAIAVDSTGAAYVGGETDSSDFPATGGAFQTAIGSPGVDDGFVAKLNAAGTALTYATYLGGNSGDTVTGIALDGSNNAYVTGVTLSPNFPTTVGAFDTKCGTDVGGTCNSGSDDSFVTEINAAGSALVYSTFLGGSSTDDAEAIAVDSTGAAYVTGLTASNDFPTVGGVAPNTFNGGIQDAFVTKVAPGGASLTYSTYLGGGGSEEGFSIALDSSKNAYVTGETDSSTGFPLVSALSNTISGTSDAFVTEVAANGSSFLFSTYFGGAGTEDQLQGSIAVDGTGNIYVTGDTTSSSGFPLASAEQAAFGGSSDAFVAKMAPGAGAANFGISATALSPATVAAGASSTSTVTLTASNGFNSNVTLSCSSITPAVSVPPTCSFATNPVTGGAGSSVLTVHTTAKTAASASVRKGPIYAAFLPIGGLALLSVGFRSRKNRLLAVLLGCMVFSGLIFLNACGSGGSGGGGGGGGGGGTAAGTYTVTVSGSGGGATHTTGLSLTVQ